MLRRLNGIDSRTAGGLLLLRLLRLLRLRWCCRDRRYRDRPHDWRYRGSTQQARVDAQRRQVLAGNGNADGAG